MHKNTSPNADKSPQTSPEAPFTTFIQLDGRSPVPSLSRTPGTFTITRLQSPAGLPYRITKLSPAPALLVSISRYRLAVETWSWMTGLRKQAEPTQLARCTLNRYLLILKRLILESSVRAGSPNFVAAPDGPETRP